MNFDSEKHSPLNFINDRGTLSIRSAQTITLIENRAKLTPYNVSANTTNTREGQILIWRSHMSHGYTLPNSCENRITLSFNSMPKTLNNGAYKFSVSE